LSLFKENQLQKKHTKKHTSGASAKAVFKTSWHPTQEEEAANAIAAAIEKEHAVKTPAAAAAAAAAKLKGAKNPDVLPPKEATSISGTSSRSTSFGTLSKRIPPPNSDSDTLLQAAAAALAAMTTPGSKNTQPQQPQPQPRRSSACEPSTATEEAPAFLSTAAPVPLAGVGVGLQPAVPVAPSVHKGSISRSRRNSSNNIDLPFLAQPTPSTPQPATTTVAVVVVSPPTPATPQQGELLHRTPFQGLAPSSDSGEDAPVSPLSRSTLSSYDNVIPAAETAGAFRLALDSMAAKIATHSELDFIATPAPAVPSSPLPPSTAGSVTAFTPTVPARRSSLPSRESFSASLARQSGDANTTADTTGPDPDDVVVVCMRRNSNSSGRAIAHSAAAIENNSGSANTVRPRRPLSIREVFRGDRRHSATELITDAGGLGLI
jgi:hypothetical protein